MSASEAPALSGVAVVTGGGRGIGASLARELSSCGMRVAVAARTAKEIGAVAREVGGLALELDVTDHAAVRHAMAEVQSTLGPIELLVANAGINGPTDSMADPDAWWRTFEVNVYGVYLCNLEVVGHMRRRGRGRVINVTSDSAYIPSSRSAAYAASKVAVHRFSELLAQELAADGVKVFSISPGIVRTAMLDGLAIPEDAPWTPGWATPQLVTAIASGALDSLVGRYLNARDDPPSVLRGRAAEIESRDLNAIRLRRE